MKNHKFAFKGAGKGLKQIAQVPHTFVTTCWHQLQFHATDEVQVRPSPGLYPAVMRRRRTQSEVGHGCRRPWCFLKSHGSVDAVRKGGNYFFLCHAAGRGGGCHDAAAAHLVGNAHDAPSPTAARAALRPLARERMCALKSAPGQGPMHFEVRLC